MITDQIVAYVDFLDGVRRAVYEQLDGRQYVIGYDGEPEHGVWWMPRFPEGPEDLADADLPMIVDKKQ